MNTAAGALLVLTGPSGVGKGTLRTYLQSCLPHLKSSVSATTRPKREGETHGMDYFFVTRTEFEQMIQENALLEWAEFAGNLYGTPKAFVQSTLNSGDSVLLEIEVQGALNIKADFPAAHLVFIEPPSVNVLEARLRGRNTNDEADIQRRMEAARWELSQVGEFHHVLVNDNLAECEQALIRLVTQLLSA